MSSQSLGFFNLPRELRDIIYPLVLQPKLCSEYSIKRGPNNRGPFLGHHRSKPGEFHGCINLLLLCRRSYDECQRFLQQIPRTAELDAGAGGGFPIVKFKRILGGQPDPDSGPPLRSQCKRGVDVPVKDIMNAKYLFLEVSIFGLDSRQDFQDRLQWIANTLSQSTSLELVDFTVFNKRGKGTLWTNRGGEDFNERFYPLLFFGLGSSRVVAVMMEFMWLGKCRKFE